MSKKVCHYLIFLFVFAASLGAQTSSITGTITDANGQLWTNGSWSISLYPIAGNPGPYYNSGSTTPVTTPYSGVLDGSGSFSATIQRNDYIAPAGTQWVFQVCPQASSPCFRQILSITSPSVNVTSLITPPGVAVSPNPPQMSYAYTDSEIVSPGPGSFYTNLSDSHIHYCSAFADEVCTWSTTGGGGTVTSVGLSTPPYFTPSGPVTGSGTLSFAATTGESPNLFLATPSSGTGPLALRAIANADLPTLSFNSLHINGDTSPSVFGVLGSGEISLAPNTESGTATPTGGSGSTWGYTATELIGGSTAPNTGPDSQFTASNNSTLNGSDYNTLSVPCHETTYYVQFYRTLSAGTPSTTGAIGSPASCASGTATLVDNALTGNSIGVPSNNTSSILLNQVTSGTTEPLTLQAPGGSSYTEPVLNIYSGSNTEQAGSNCCGGTVNIFGYGDGVTAGGQINIATLLGGGSNANFGFTIQDGVFNLGTPATNGQSIATSYFTVPQTASYPIYPLFPQGTLTFGGNTPTGEAFLSEWLTNTQGGGNCGAFTFDSCVSINGGYSNGKQPTALQVGEIVPNGSKVVTGQQGNFGPLTVCNYTSSQAQCGTASMYEVKLFIESAGICATPGGANVEVTYNWTDSVGAKSSLAILKILTGDGAGTTGTSMYIGDTVTSASAEFSIFSTGGNTIYMSIAETGCTSGTGTYNFYTTVNRIN